MMNKLYAILIFLVAINVVQAKEPLWLTSSADFSRTNSAPFFVKNIVLDEVPKTASIRLAVAGWLELTVNGKRVGENVLSPVTCQPDLRISELTFDLSSTLNLGTNEIRALVGNGWWYCATEGAWGFERAPWHFADSKKRGPMIYGSIIVDGKCVAVTDESWLVEDSPILFNQLRNGEYYDARQEGKLRNHRPAIILQGEMKQIISAEDAPQCRIYESNDPVSSKQLGDDVILFDFGHNVAGWCEIDVIGETGAKIIIEYGELLNANGSFNGEISRFNKNRRWAFQHDEYTLAGRPGGERWHPRFTYHGFRYARVKIVGKAELKCIRQQVVHSDLPSIGNIETSSVEFSKLQDAIRRSYLSNFVGIPTDCPHREKNGWTGDAQIACESGLWNFDAKNGYVHFVRMMLDTQKPSGAVPCILPCTPFFGYAWGTGPAWDMMLFEIPRQIYRFTGDDSIARESYDAMKRYLEYAKTKRRDDGLFQYGLGDWCHPIGTVATTSRYTDTAIIYHMFCELSFWADLFGEKNVYEEAQTYANDVREAFNREYYKGHGVYGNNFLTELAAPLYFKGLCADGAHDEVVSNLVERVRQERHRSVFGILGAKWIPRSLAESGYVEDAWKIFTQSEFPSFQKMLANEDTLWETFKGSGSHNHIMFGDGSAWAFEYVAGINPLKPGFSEVSVEPHPIPGVDSFRATYITPHSIITAGWETVDGMVKLVRDIKNRTEKHR